MILNVNSGKDLFALEVDSAVQVAKILYFKEMMIFLALIKLNCMDSTLMLLIGC